MEKLDTYNLGQIAVCNSLDAVAFVPISSAESVVVSSNSSVTVLTQSVTTSSSCMVATLLPLQSLYLLLFKLSTPRGTLFQLRMPCCHRQVLFLRQVRLLLCLQFSCPLSHCRACPPFWMPRPMHCCRLALVFPSRYLPPSATAQQGRWPFLVPSFVNTSVMPIASHSIAMRFSAPPLISVHVTSSSSSPGWPASTGSSSLPSFQQPFVVGPGFSPIPAKLVAQIVLGEFLDLSDLLSANMAQQDPEPQLLLDGRVVLILPHQNVINDVLRTLHLGLRCLQSTP